MALTLLPHATARAHLDSNFTKCEDRQCALSAVNASKKPSRRIANGRLRSKSGIGPRELRIGATLQMCDSLGETLTL